MAMGNVWTADTLAAHLVGELNQDRNAAGGLTPDRLLNLIFESYQWLWQSWPWKFRRVRYTLTIAAAAETTALPADFEKVDSKWLESNDRHGALAFTEDVEEFETLRRLRGTTNTGTPNAALIEQVSLTSALKQVRVSPIPAQQYTYVMVYLRIAPDIEHDGTVYWPTIMHNLWHALAKAKTQRGFRRDDAWKESWAYYKTLENHAHSENDEHMRSSTPVIRDGYGDIQSLPSVASLYGWASDSENLIP